MNQTQSSTLPRSKTYEITITALMTAVTCILAPMSIPIGPVPISFTNLAIYLSLYLLGWKRGTISYLIYLLIGLVGLPVFSGFTGGPAKLAGPTGGYIIGFIVMAIIAGLVIDNCRKPWLQLIGMIVGTIVCYLFGTIWFCATPFKVWAARNASSTFFSSRVLWSWEKLGSPGNFRTNLVISLSLRRRPKTSS